MYKMGLEGYDTSWCRMSTKLYAVRRDLIAGPSRCGFESGMWTRSCLCLVDTYNSGILAVAMNIFNGILNRVQIHGIWYFSYYKQNKRKNIVNVEFFRFNAAPSLNEIPINLQSTCTKYLIVLYPLSKL